MLRPASKPASGRYLADTSLGQDLEVSATDRDALYGALDWLGARQDAIERILARRHLVPGGLVLLPLLLLPHRDALPAGRARLLPGREARQPADHLRPQVERAFRGLKSVEIAVRPIFHYREDRVRAHLFLCFLAYYVRWHLEVAWAPLLYRDEAPPTRTDPALPPTRSAAALAKERVHQTPEGLPVGSFRTLLAELATLTRNRVVPAGTGEGAAFELLSEPTPLQARALELIGVSPGSM